MPTWVRLIGEHPLSWEMLPDAALSQPKVWRALIERGLPQAALIRQLPRSTRLIVVGLTATNVSIADPNNPAMLDIAGFDAAVPNLIADFSRGDL